MVDFSADAAGGWTITNAEGTSFVFDLDGVRDLGRDVITGFDAREDDLTFVGVRVREGGVGQFAGQGLDRDP